MRPPERKTARRQPSGFSNLWNNEARQSYSPDLPSARHLASLLGGDVARDRVLCPGPGHSSHDRSLSVRLNSAAADGFMVNSFSGDDWRECRDYVRARLGLPHGRGRVASKSLGHPPMTMTCKAHRSGVDLSARGAANRRHPRGSLSRRPGRALQRRRASLASICPFGKGRARLHCRPGAQHRHQRTAGDPSDCTRRRWPQDRPQGHGADRRRRNQAHRRRRGDAVDCHRRRHRNRAEHPQPAGHVCDAGLGMYLGRRDRDLPGAGRHRDRSGSPSTTTRPASSPRANVPTAGRAGSEVILLAPKKAGADLNDIGGRNVSR